MLHRLFALLLLFVPVAPVAADQYLMEVTGLACPFCARNVSQRLDAIDGVQAVAVDLEKGQVTVTVAAGTRLTEERMRHLFHEAGFTFRGMRRIAE